jgi:uncharacterized protein YkwD
MSLVGATAAVALASSPAAAATHTQNVAALVSRCTSASVAAGTTTARAAMFKQLSCVRSTAGLPAFRLSLPISGVARQWSGAMATADALEHNPNLAQAASAVDPRWLQVGEVIGTKSAGTNQTGAIVAAWLHSPEHRAELLDPQLRVVGVGLMRSGPALWATVDLVDRA